MTSAGRINCPYVLLLLILATSMLIPEVSYGRIVDRVLATVGGEAITLADYQKFVRTGGDVSINETVEQDVLQKMIEENGGKNMGSVSSKTNFLIAGENMGPAKLAKAEQLGILIISETEFLKMLETS